MKRAIYIIVILAVLAFCAWLFLHRPKSTLEKPASLLTQIQTTNSVVVPPVTNMSASVADTNAFIRPDYIDEEHWNRLMLVRQMILEQIQPVVFYARVEDEGGNPVEGAQLKITLSRINEKMFETTNFFHMNMGDEIVHIQLNLLSDVSGWIRVTNMTGKALWVESLSKEGYSWTMPQIDSFAYGINGERTVGYAEMRDAFDPNKGYVFHLQKIEGK